MAWTSRVAVRTASGAAAPAHGVAVHGFEHLDRFPTAKMVEDLA